MNKVEIANIALNALGARRISSLDDDTSEEARTINMLYNPTLREIVSHYDWNSLIKRSRLAAVVGETLSIYSNCYQLPGDCSRVLSLLDPTTYDEMDRAKGVKLPERSDSHIFVREGDKLYTDVDGGIIKYVHIPSGTVPDAIGRVVSFRLAHESSIRLGRDVQLSKILEQEFERLLLRAKAADNADSVSDNESVLDWSSFR